MDARYNAAADMLARSWHEKTKHWRKIANVCVASVPISTAESCSLLAAGHYFPLASRIIRDEGHVRNEIDDASLIVAFTDLEIEPESMLGPEPDCPVLWAAVGYPDRVKQYLKNTPWGAPGIEVVPSYN
jgi:hypothetical protein